MKVSIYTESLAQAYQNAKNYNMTDHVCKYKYKLHHCQIQSWMDRHIVSETAWTDMLILLIC